MLGGSWQSPWQNCILLGAAVVRIALSEHGCRRRGPEVHTYGFCAGATQHTCASLSPMTNLR